MKYKFWGMCLLLILSACSTRGRGEPVKYMPDKPRSGDEVLIRFNAEDTDLETAENIDVIIYRVIVDTIYCDEYPMTKTDNGWEYKYDIPETAWSAGVKFTDGETEVDDNGFNFPMFLYDDNGQFLKGTRASYASSCLNALVFTTQPGTGKAYSLFKEEFEDNPELTKYFLSKYVYSLGQEKPDGWKEKIKSILESINANAEELNEKALYELEFTYRYIIKDKEKAEEYNKMAITKYPLGLAAQSETRDEIKKLNDKNIAELKDAVFAYRAKFGDNTIYTYSIWKKLIEAYCENEMYDELKKFLSENESILQELSLMNSISEEARKIAEDNGNLEFAKYLIDFAYSISGNYEPSDTDFRGDTEAEREFKIDGYISRTLYNAAYVYERAGEPRKALELIEEAYSHGEPVDDVKIMQAKLLLELNKDSDKALTTTAGLILESKVTNEITGLNKEAYIQVNGSADGYGEYFDELRRPLLDERREEIKANLVNEPAPDFSLTDLDGNTVTLSELKGKVVILDFWASWCMPCKASMPLMKDAVEKYADDKDVEFFFVDTFERGKESFVRDRAKEFIADNNYPFHVLIDADGKVAKDGYGITTIPAKVFIDKNGNKRFLSSGFDKAKLLDEIDIIIELIK